jgi:hypothetical protein
VFVVTAFTQQWRRAVRPIDAQASETPITVSTKSPIENREPIPDCMSAARGIIYGAIGGLLAWAVIIGLMFEW